MLFSRIWFSCLTVVVAQSHLMAGVIGPDDRRPPAADETTLLQSLVQVFCAKLIGGIYYRSASTATVVGNRNTILTVAHAFTDRPRSDDPQSVSLVHFDPVDDCRFRQFDANGSITFEAAFQSVEMGAFRNDPGTPNDDWAVLKTAQPLPENAVALAFANGSGEPGSFSGLPIKILAFHADLEHARRVPLLSEGKLLSVEYAGHTRLAHTADIGRMSSGAAIVHRTRSGEYIVVGVNRSSANLGEFNLAVPMSGALQRVLNNHARGHVPAHDQRIAML